MELLRPDLRLGPRVVRFSDGAVAPAELFDVGRNRPCVRVETSHGIRCLPENVVFVGGEHGPYFVDRACTVPMAHAIAPACLQPTLALKLDTGQRLQPGDRRFRALPPTSGAIPREVFSGPDCRDRQILPGHFYLPGDPVDLTLFPELEVQESGNGRIRVRSFAARDGVSIPTLGQHLFDTQLGRGVPGGGGQRRRARAACRCPDRRWIADADAGSDEGFADAACTRPLARYQGAQACGGPRPPAAMVARVSSRRCLHDGETGPGSRDDRQPGRWEILQLGARHEGEVFFKLAGACQPGSRAPRARTSTSWARRWSPPASWRSGRNSGGRTSETRAARGARRGRGAGGPARPLPAAGSRWARAHPASPTGPTSRTRPVHWTRRPAR